MQNEMLNFVFPILHPRVPQTRQNSGTVLFKLGFIFYFLCKFFKIHVNPPGVCVLVGSEYALLSFL